MRIRKTIRSIKSRIYWGVNQCLWILPRFVRRAVIGSIPEIGFSIIVTTYIERYESCLQPIIKRLAELFPRNQIIVVANGHYDQKRQQKYLVDIRQYCAKYSNVLLIDFFKPESVCKIFNTALLQARSNVILSINEDTWLSLFFPRELLRSGILNEDMAIVNNTWSTSLITKDIFRKVGFLDERLLEIGGDDDDYAARCALLGISIPYYYMKTIRVSPKKTRKKDILNSWGKLMQDQRGGYSSLNSDFLLNKKWETSDEPFEGATFVPNRKPKYWKLRPGMETPDFYPGLLQKDL